MGNQMQILEIDRAIVIDPDTVKIKNATADAQKVWSLSAVSWEQKRRQVAGRNKNWKIAIHSLSPRVMNVSTLLFNS